MSASSFETGGGFQSPVQLTLPMFNHDIMQSCNRGTAVPLPHDANILQARRTDLWEGSEYQFDRPGPASRSQPWPHPSRSTSAGAVKGSHEHPGRRPPPQSKSKNHLSVTVWGVIHKLADSLQFNDVSNL